MSGDELIVEDTINASFHHALIVGQGGRVDHIVYDHIGKDVGKHREYHFTDEACFIKERKGEERG